MIQHVKPRAFGYNGRKRESGGLMALEMKLDYRLRWLDFDRFGRIQPTTVLDLCQDIATIQAEDMGIGRDDMLARGVFWAIVRMKYEVVKAPAHYQVVTVHTWPHSPSSFSFMRDFHLLDEAGDLLVRASSEWVLMDVETRKFAKMKAHYDGPYDFRDERAFEGKLRKVATFDEGNRPVRTVVPAFSDIDVNGHVNNARYPRFVIDALDPGEECAIRSLQIDYRHEALPGAPLAVHTLVEDGSVLSKGVREDGNVAFACAIELG